MKARAVRLDQHRELWSRYSSNLPRHLIGLARHLQAEALRELGGRGYADLRLSFEPYISLVGESGCRLRDLAEALGISKQACNQAADEIERAGYLRRTDDPDDRRGRRLLLTARGRALVRDGLVAARRVQSAYAAELGKARLTRLVRICARLDTGLSAASASKAPAAPAGAELGALLPRLSRYLMQSLMDRTRARGHAGLKLSHGQVLSLIGPTGGRMQQMARIQQVSKQAIGAVARDLEALGYIGRSADPDDARQVVLALTARGVRLLEDSIASVDELRGEFTRLLDAAGLADLEALAAELYLGLGLEQEVFATPDQLDRLVRNLRQQLGEHGVRALARLLQDPPRDIAT
jgi:DNA-binding MarR family transcriptional regulator